MKRTPAVLALALLTASCTGGSAPTTHAGSSPSPTSAASSAAPTATPPAAPRPAATPSSPADRTLAKLLLRATDLPTGYTRDAVTRGTALPVSTSDSVCAQRFSALNGLRSAGPLAATATARASFSKGTAGPFLRTAIRRYRTEAAAGRILAAVADIFHRCPSFTATQPTTGRLTSVTLTPLRFPHLGQQGVAVGGRLTSGGKGVDIDLVFVRTAASIAYVAELAGGAVDVPALERAVRTEVARLSAAS